MAEDDTTIDNSGRVMKLARALDHGLRIEIILAHANGGPASATNLAVAGLDSLGNVAYHQVVLRDIGVLKRVSTRKKRGAHEHLYDLSDFGKEVLRVAVDFGKKQK